MFFQVSLASSQENRTVYSYVLSAVHFKVRLLYRGRNNTVVAPLTELCRIALPCHVPYARASQFTLQFTRCDHEVQKEKSPE